MEDGGRHFGTGPAPRGLRHSNGAGGGGVGGEGTLLGFRVYYIPLEHYFCLYTTEEDIYHSEFIKVLYRGSIV